MKRKLFYTYEYNTDKKFDEISNTLDWFYKSQSDEFNDKIFNEIIKFKNTGKIKIIKKKIKSLKKNTKNDKKPKLNLFEIIDTLLSKIGIFSNTIFFDKTNFDKLDFIKNMFKNISDSIKKL